MSKTRPNPFPQELHFDNAGFINGKRLIVITRAFPVVSSLGCFTVHSGFLSDGASIPRMAQAIVGNPFDEYLEDAVAHDWLYSKASDRLMFDRSEADHVLKETMWNRCIPVWKVAAFHAAVRLGGWKSYKKR